MADSDLSAGSPERFGYSWDIHHDILPVHEEQFIKWTTGLPREAWQGKRFLDVGCGMGRNSHWAMTFGAAGGTSIDVDERSLAHARQNLARHGDKVEVRHQSAYDISESKAYDIAFSVGVIHHLAFPERAVARMISATRPGGVVLLWLYGYENNRWIVWFFDPLRKYFFSRLPLPVVSALAWVPTLSLWLAVRTGLFGNSYFRQLRHFSLSHIKHIVFDHMLPRIARYYRKEEALSLLTHPHLETPEIHWVNEVSWTVMARKRGES